MEVLVSPGAFVRELYHERMLEVAAPVKFKGRSVVPLSSIKAGEEGHWACSKASDKGRADGDK